MYVRGIFAAKRLLTFFGPKMVVFLYSMLEYRMCVVSIEQLGPDDFAVSHFLANCDSYNGFLLKLLHSYASMY